MFLSSSIKKYYIQKYIKNHSSTLMHILRLKFSSQENQDTSKSDKRHDYKKKNTNSQPIREAAETRGENCLEKTSSTSNQEAPTIPSQKAVAAEGVNIPKKIAAARFHKL